MRRVKAKNSKIELAVRRSLWAKGVRYRLHDARFPGKPDIYIPRLRLAVFVNGCFWHGHSCPRGGLPRTNAAFWSRKISQNVQRDARAYAALTEAGIGYVVLWGCKMAASNKLVAAIGRRYRLDVRAELGKSMRKTSYGSARKIQKQATRASKKELRGGT